MPNMESLKAFLVDQHRQDFLPSDPSFLFTRGFLENLVAFMDGNGASQDGNGADQRSCKRCDVVIDSMSRQIEVIKLWQRHLQGGASHAHE